jgi:hypothetical protein
MINIQLTLNHEKQTLSDFFFSIYFNMGFLKLLGRVLIITALVSSAYHHLKRPNHTVEEFKANYNTLDQLSKTYLQYDIPLDNVRLDLIRQIG